ncbi:MAG: lysophospholipid acyltransferase family protein [Bryobacteraceae bacterium]
MIQSLAARLLLFTLANSPIGFARFCTKLLDLGLPRLRRIAIRNLELAFPPETPAFRERIVDGVFRSIARLLWMFARFPKMNRGNIEQWISYEGLENYRKAKEQGRGILIATAHLGNWELSAFAHGLLTEPMNIVIRPLDDPRIDRMVEDRRKLSGNRLIEKWDSARAVLRALHQNEPVGVLIDQNTTLQEGAFVDFFGIPACANTALVRLAGRTGAPVIPGFALWSEAKGRYILRFYPEVPITGDVHRDTQALHAVLEGVIREHPDQWLWIHRRWKTRPPGEPPIYGTSSPETDR